MWSSNNQPQNYTSGHKKASTTLTNNLKWPKNKQLCTPQTSANSLDGKLSLPTTYSHHEKPCCTEAVWAFFVHIRLREITLKMLSWFFCLNGCHIVGAQLLVNFLLPGDLLMLTDQLFWWHPAICLCWRLTTKLSFENLCHPGIVFEILCFWPHINTFFKGLQNSC